MNYKNFVKNLFEKKSAVLHDVNQITLTEKEILNIIESLTQRNIEGLVKKIYFDGILQNPEDIQKFPSLRDGSLEKYYERIKSDYNVNHFIIYITGNNDVIKNINQVLIEYSNFLNVSLDNIDIELFLGKYELTPGGVHKEECTNIHHVIYGQKNMIIWEPNYFDFDDEIGYKQIDPHTNEVEYFLKNVSIEDINRGNKLTANKGDIFYWPTHYWHVGESPNISFSVNFAIYSNKK